MFIAVPIAGMIRVLIAHFVPKASAAEAKPELTAEPKDEARERQQTEARPVRPKATPRGQT